MDDLKYFLWEQLGPTATVTFNRPHKRNAIDLTVMLELESILHRARDAGDIKVLILTGAGSAFCAGADLSLMRDARTSEEKRLVEGDMALVPRVLGRVFDTMVHMDVISIAAVNGFAVGGGWTIALGCDHVVATDDARFWLPEVEIGGPFRGLANLKLTHRLGSALAKEAMILCRRFNAQELLELRVINEVCEPPELMARARRVAESYLALSWKAVISTRRDIHAALYGPQHY
jgi:enoyl-CoA hydratase